MPTIPLPPGGSAIAGGVAPVSGPEDVLAEFPTTHKQPTAAPVRDAFVEGFTDGFLEYQDIAARAAAIVDPMRSTGEYLRSFADERGVIPEGGESEASLRSRLFAVPDIVTPNAIREGVNAILAPFTDKECHLSELELDGLFIHDGTSTLWNSFIGAEPDYPDRYYAERPWLLPGGAVPSAGYPRSFLLRVPSLDQVDVTATYILDTAAGIFVGDGSDTSGSETNGVIGFSVFVGPKLSDDVYSAIVSLVERIKGQGITWTFIADPSL